MFVNLTSTLPQLEQQFFIFQTHKLCKGPRINQLNPIPESYQEYEILLYIYYNVQPEIYICSQHSYKKLTLVLLERYY